MRAANQRRIGIQQRLVDLVVGAAGRLPGDEQALVAHPGHVNVGLDQAGAGSVVDVYALGRAQGAVVVDAAGLKNALLCRTDAGVGFAGIGQPEAAAVGGGGRQTHVVLVIGVGVSEAADGEAAAGDDAIGVDLRAANLHAFAVGVAVEDVVVVDDQAVAVAGAGYVDGGCAFVKQFIRCHGEGVDDGTVGNQIVQFVEDDFNFKGINEVVGFDDGGDVGGAPAGTGRGGREGNGHGDGAGGGGLPAQRGRVRAPNRS